MTAFTVKGVIRKKKKINNYKTKVISRKVGDKGVFVSVFYGFSVPPGS